MNHMQRKGDLTTPVTLWFIGIATGILLLGWYLRSISSGADVGAMDEDIKNMHYTLALACNNDGIIDDIPLHTMRGTVLANASDICVKQTTNQNNITRCISMPCDLSLDTAINVNGATTIRINKTGLLTTISRVE